MWNDTTLAAFQQAGKTTPGELGEAMPDHGETLGHIAGDDQPVVRKRRQVGQGVPVDRMAEVQIADREEAHSRPPAASGRCPCGVIPTPVSPRRGRRRQPALACSHRILDRSLEDGQIAPSRRYGGRGYR
jgi:hypothetical protein